MATTVASESGRVLDPLTSVTGALVESNDRLLGLIALTSVEHTSLDEITSVGALVDKARTILGADVAELSGTAQYRSGTTSTTALSQMSTSKTLSEYESFDLCFWREDPFGTPDTKLLDAVGNLVANTIRAARMNDAAVAQAVVAGEHETAARITSAALPDPESVPQLTNASMYASMLPARNTGGDLFAWRMIDDTLWFAIGDVSGKGLPAAVLMTTVMNAVTVAIHDRHTTGVEAVFESIERWAFEPLSNAAMFVTLAVGCYTPDTASASGDGAGVLQIANAGHSPIVFSRNGVTDRVSATSPPIGVIAGLLPEVQTMVMDTHDVMVLASDGFTEQENLAGTAFGEDRFDTEIGSFASHRSAGEIGRDLAAQVADHAGSQEQSDDRTIIVLRFGQ